MIEKHTQFKEPKVYSYATLQERKKARYFARKRCPICGRVGSGPYARRVGPGSRRYLYFKHARSGHPPKIWHYIGPEDAVLAAGGAEKYLENLRSSGNT